MVPLGEGGSGEGGRVGMERGRDSWHAIVLQLRRLGQCSASTSGTCTY